MSMKSKSTSLSSRRVRRDRVRQYFAAIAALLLVFALCLSLFPALVGAEETTNPSANPTDSDSSKDISASSTGEDFTITVNPLQAAFYNTCTAFLLQIEPSMNWKNNWSSPTGSITSKALEILQIELVQDPSSPFEIMETRNVVNGESKSFIKKGETGMLSNPYHSFYFSKLKVKPDVKEGPQSISFIIRYRSKVNDTIEYKEANISVYIHFIADPAQPVNKKAILIAQDSGVPKGGIGDLVPIKLGIINRGSAPVVIKNVIPQIGADFPFEMERSDYSVSVDQYLYPLNANASPSLEQQTLVEIDYGQMRVRPDVKTGYVPVTFNVDYILDGSPDITSEKLTLYFDLKGKDEGREGEAGKSSQPRLLIEKFSTNPERLMGGQPFELKLLLKNTSLQTSVNNIRISVEGQGEDQVFMPAQGTSAFFLASIPAGGSTELNIPMTSSSKAPSKSYPLMVNLEYEDAQMNPCKGMERVTLQLYQEDRLEWGKIELTPENPQVDQELNVVFPLFNKGKSTLYNVSVVVPEGLPVKGSETYIGNMEPGANKSVDFMLRAESEYMDPKAIELDICFENEEGAKTIKKLPLQMMIMPAEPMPVNPDHMPGENENEELATPWYRSWPLIGAVVTGLLLLGIILGSRIRHKRKKARQEAMDFDDEF